jgi:hypothetical protein
VLKVRRLIAPIACAWLLMHVFAIAGTTVLLVATGASDLVCTCAHDGDHGACPMHHKPADAERCRMQGTQSEVGALLTMLGPLTLPLTAATVVVDTTTSSPIEHQSPFLSNGALPFDPPPPRS